MVRRRWPELAADIACDHSGIAATEFALLLPALLILFLGSYETSNLVIAYMKLEAAAETAADLVAQTAVNTVLQSTDFTHVTDAAELVLTPLPTSSTQLKIAYASVTYSTGTAVIDWHLEVNGATAITTTCHPAYHRASANLRRRYGIGGVVIAAMARRSWMVFKTKRRLKRQAKAAR